MVRLHANSLVHRRPASSPSLSRLCLSDASLTRASTTLVRERAHGARWPLAQPLAGRHSNPALDTQLTVAPTASFEALSNGHNRPACAVPRCHWPHAKLLHNRGMWSHNPSGASSNNTAPSQAPIATTPLSPDARHFSSQSVAPVAPRQWPEGTEAFRLQEDEVGPLQPWRMTRHLCRLPCPRPRHALTWGMLWSTWRCPCAWAVGAAWSA
jgi:hypothetical protein